MFLSAINISRFDTHMLHNYLLTYLKRYMSEEFSVFYSVSNFKLQSIQASVNQSHINQVQMWVRP